MRLWLALVGIVVAPAGLLLYGLSTAEVSFSIFDVSLHMLTRLNRVSLGFFRALAQPSMALGSLLSAMRL
jgi:hypothetical protein